MPVLLLRMLHMFLDKNFSLKVCLFLLLCPRFLLDLVGGRRLSLSVGGVRSRAFPPKAAAAADDDEESSSRNSHGLLSSLRRGAPDFPIVRLRLRAFLMGKKRLWQSLDFESGKENESE